MYKIIIALSFLMTGCSDSSINLGEDYFLRIDGPRTNEIMNRKANVKGIPPAVMRYNYNDDFIVAEQKPSNHNDVMHDDGVIYSKGRDFIYYWIIVKKSKAVLGPMEKGEYEKMKNKYGMSSTFLLKDVY